MKKHFFSPLEEEDSGIAGFPTGTEVLRVQSLYKTNSYIHTVIFQTPIQFSTVNQTQKPFIFITFTKTEHVSHRFLLPLPYLLYRHIRGWRVGGNGGTSEQNLSL